MTSRQIIRASAVPLFLLSPFLVAAAVVMLAIAIKSLPAWVGDVGNIIVPIILLVPVCELLIVVAAIAYRRLQKGGTA